jgi:hypothetical protein
MFTCLVWAGDDLRKLALLFILALDNGLDNGRVIASEVNEDV